LPRRREGNGHQPEMRETRGLPQLGGSAPRPNRPWGRSSNRRNPSWSGQFDLRKDDHGAEAPAGSVHKAPRRCLDRNGAAGARQFVIDAFSGKNPPWRLLDVADKSPLRGRLWGSAGLCARFTRKYFKTYSARSDAALAFRFDRTPTRLLLVALCGRWLFELLDELS
jgi:hypothetical protein